MVLDMRFLQAAVEDAQTADHQTGPDAAAAASAGAELEDLLEQAVAAATPAGRTAAVAQLRALVPSGAGIERLCQIIADTADRRRLVAVHTLGFHRDWLGAGTVNRRLIEWIPEEADVEVARAMVWCLRETEAPALFLLADGHGLALEAALGLRLGRQSLSAVVEALRLGRAAAIEQVLVERLQGLPLHLVEVLIDCLLESDWERDDAALERLLQGLPQVPLFEQALEPVQGQGWNPQQGLGTDAKTRRAQALATAAEGVLKEQPGGELLRYLLNRSGEDETFARRFAPFLKDTLGNADTVKDGELLHYFARLTARASGDKVVRLAQMLVQLSARLEGPSGAKATALLEEWKDRYPHLRLKLFHLQQGWI